MSAVKSRWWRCTSCIKDINAKEINDSGKTKAHHHLLMYCVSCSCVKFESLFFFSDCRLQSQSRSVKEKNLKAGTSSAVPSRRRLNWLSVSDKKKTKKNHVQTGSSEFNVAIVVLS